MDIVIGSWEKTQHNSNGSGGSKYDPFVSFRGGLRQECEAFEGVRGHYQSCNRPHGKILENVR